MPTALIITSGFVEEADLQRSALGMPALRAVVVDHPVSTLGEEQLSERARQAAPQVAAILTGVESAAPDGDEGDT